MAKSLVEPYYDSHWCASKLQFLLQPFSESKKQKIEKTGELRVLSRLVIKWVWSKWTIIITGINFGDNENKHDLYSPVFQSSSPFQWSNPVNAGTRRRFEARALWLLLPGYYSSQHKPTEVSTTEKREKTASIDEARQAHLVSHCFFETFFVKQDNPLTAGKDTL